MSKATLTLTDNAGKLDLHVAYEGGLNLENPSHEHMLLLIATLDQMAEPIGEPVHILMPNGAEAPEPWNAGDAPPFERKLLLLN